MLHEGSKKMKRILIVMVALIAMVAFASGAVAQAPAKTEKPAAAPEKVAPAPAPAAEKAPKAKEAKPSRFAGTVAAYEAGKSIKVKGAKDKEMAFDVTPDTKVKGDVKEGAKVTVLYKKEADKNVATSISVPPPPKKKAAPEKKAVPDKKA